MGPSGNGLVCSRAIFKDICAGLKQGASSVIIARFAGPEISLAEQFQIVAHLLGCFMREFKIFLGASEDLRTRHREDEGSQGLGRPWPPSNMAIGQVNTK